MGGSVLMSLAPVSIRSMKKADVHLLHEIARANMPYAWSKRVFMSCFREDYHGWLVSQGNHGLANEVMGFAIVLAQLDECQLLNVCVKSSARRQGLASLLLDEVASFSKDNAFSKVFLEVRHSNEEAIALYRHYGFEQVGRRRRYYKKDDEREDALLFRLAVK